MFAGGNEAEAVRTPDGRVIDREALIRDLQRRMDMTRQIDHLTEEIDQIEIADDRAVLLSKQSFSRVVSLPEGKERRHISAVTHRRVYRRTRDGWEPAGPVQEIDPVARWADEP